jgi:hypothetical protein
MTNKLMIMLTCISLLAWPAELAVPAPPPINQYPVSSMFKFDYKQLLVAHRVERRLRRYGFSDELIAGALVNAYAESEFDVLAVGGAGERGIFQLNPHGLGHGMTIDEMQSISTSVDRIASALQKSDRVMDLEDRHGSIEDHVLMFCKEIERPGHKEQRARERVKLMERIMID